MFFFFKQKTAYDMRISDWSSDVCSSDLVDLALERPVEADAGMPQLGKLRGDGAGDDRAAEQLLAARDRQALRQQLRARRLAPLTDLGPFLHFSSLQKRPARKGGPDRKSTRLNSSH